MNITTEELKRGYQAAGEVFLAAKLQKIFSEIQTPEDIALHNDMLHDIWIMISDPPGFRRMIARILMYETPKQWFLRRAAQSVLTFLAKGALHGTKAKK